MIRVKNIFKGKILDIINDEVMSHRNENVKTITTLKEVLEKIKQLKSAYYFKRESEHVSVPDSVGRELSEDIVADYLSPAFDISAMDGFAFRCEDNYPLKISGSVYAGDSIAKINNGEAMAIATGAILPEGADTVLKIEDAKVRKDLLYGKKLKTWENVFRKGSDYHAGDRIFEKNHRIMPQSAALLYSLGVEKVPVYTKIRAGIISTGTEIYNGMIKNTNAVLIQGFMKEMGCESTFVGAVQDDYNKTKIMLLEACEKFDVVFTTGGVSVGERDFVADVITEIGELLFHRVAIRPGKPLAVGIVKDIPVFSLPGKPTGTLTAIEIVVRSYFTDIPRATRELMINEDVTLPEKDFEYILFVKIVNNTASSMGRQMKLLDREYNTAIISASPRSAVVEGYVITNRDIGKGELVNVYLFN
jgi:molybdenum cofactor synthesis domain-containing protein